MCKSKYLRTNNPQFFIGVQFLASAVFFASCGSGDKIEEIKKFNDYPSASAIEYFNGQFFIMGDDARNLLILDSNLEAIDSIALYSSSERRIPKPIKADLEAITVTKTNELLLVGSGSLAPYRSGGWLINTVFKRSDSIRFDTLYRRLNALGLEVINIEGACSIPGRLLLANRGNNAWRKNDLILVSEQFWKDQSLSPVSIIRLGANIDSTVFNGVSGLDYAVQADQLLITISTENTNSSTGDGAIGKSYLWIVNNISSKMRMKTINPDKIIDLEKLDGRFLGQKVESVSVISETKRSLYLALAADNDDGSSTIITIVINKN